MIYTLTTNPAIDMNITTDGLQPKVVNRTYNNVYTPNGKGLNVSFVLGHYGVKSKILGFFGGFSGKYIVEESLKNGFDCLPIWIEETTRINIFLNDGTQEFKLVNQGALVAKEKQQDLLELIENAHDMEYLIISGSLPLGINETYYDSILMLCEKKKVKVILDISSKKLKDLLAYKPYLIKPNDEEIKEIFNLAIRDEADMVDTLKFLHQQGAQNVLLTLGEYGSYFYNGNDIFYASTQKVKLLSSACAGDAALASFLSIYLNDETAIEDALRRSAATGANVAESSGLGDFMKVDEYMKNIQVRKVE